MNDKQKKVAIVGVSALGIGYYVLSQRGDGGASGGMGSVFGTPGGDTSLPGTGDNTGEANPAATIADILSNLPPVPGYSDGGFGTPPPAAAMAGIPQVITNGGGGGGSPITKKSTGGGLLGTLSLIPKVGVYSVMKPTQILGGAAAHLEHGFEPLIFSKKHLKAHHEAQQTRRHRYPRTVHAMSMLTGGAIAHGAVTKKQYAARKRHPTIYHAWKSLFGWLGA